MFEKIFNNHQSNLMKKSFLILLVLSSTFLSFSQSNSFKISGTLIAKDVNAPLEFATVYLERVQDSSLVTYTISNKDGKFALENKTSDKNLILFISYIGYKTYRKHIPIDKENINLNIINLEADVNLLNEVVIKSRAPITIKKDTLEFNVKSFKTKKDANIEDVLKLLPGVEVDQDGRIKINGKEVSKVLVDGKPFFGNDPTIATRNLSKDIIEKIQVTDTKTKAQAFVGEEGDKENKTINLSIKKENNKGIFGRIAAGRGTNNRYEFAGMFNHFDNNQRTSVLTGGNNINSSGFSFGEIEKMFGSIGFTGGSSYAINGRSFGGGQGITSSKTGGINYADKYGEKVDVSGSYFYSRSDSDNKSTRNRENILPDTRYFTESKSTSSNSTDSHRVNTELEFKIDSTLFILAKPSFNFSNSKTVSGNSEQSSDIDRILTNESNSSSFVENDAKNFNANLSLTKRFGKNGSFLRLKLNNRINKTETDDFLDSRTQIYKNNPIDSNNPIVTKETIRNQYRDIDNTSNNFSSEIRYKLPLKGKELSLDFSYHYSNNKRNNKKSTFNKNALNQYTVFDTDLSTDFEYQHEKNTPSLRLRYRKDKISTEFTTRYILRTLENRDGLRPIYDIKRRFNNFEFNTYLRYTFSPKSSFNIGYRLNTNPPRLSRLQAFKNITNPLNIVIGNPDLEPSKNHRMYWYFNSFNFQKQASFSSYFSASINENQVISKTTIDEDLLRTTTFENVDGNYRINTDASYSKKITIDSLRTIKFNFNMGMSMNNNINYNNDVKYTSKNRSLSPRFGVEFNWKNLMEFNPNYRIAFAKNKYDLDHFDDEKFITHSIRLNTLNKLQKKLEWRNNIVFNYNSNITAHFQKKAWFWNSTLAYSILKDKGIITLKAYDLLNQNTNARRTVTANYIQDSQSTVLQRYFMLSFSWKFNTLVAKAETF